MTYLSGFPDKCHFLSLYPSSFLHPRFHFRPSPSHAAARKPDLSREFAFADHLVDLGAREPDVLLHLGDTEKAGVAEVDSRHGSPC